LSLFLHLLAQTTQSVSSPGAGPDAPPFWARQDVVLTVLLFLGIIFIFTSSGKGNRQKEKRHKELLASLKRGDRVQTIGGILGAVVEVRDEDVVLKVDESSNTKIRVIRDAIKSVTCDEAETK
jgi:preprotein translocase subunit YajC